jgi:hypothetical protein
VVFIETYQEGEFPKRPSRGVRRTYWEGYSVPGEFYSPDYSIMPPLDDDYRRTIYWNPALKTDQTGRARISFHNNGRPRNGFSVSAETISPTGLTGVCAK